MFQIDIYILHGPTSISLSYRFKLDSLALEIEAILSLFDGLTK